MISLSYSIKYYNMYLLVISVWKVWNIRFPVKYFFNVYQSIDKIIYFILLIFLKSSYETYSYIDYRSLNIYWRNVYGNYSIIGKSFIFLLIRLCITRFKMNLSEWKLYCNIHKHIADAHTFLDDSPVEFKTRVFFFSLLRRESILNIYMYTV